MTSLEQAVAAVGSRLADSGLTVAASRPIAYGVQLTVSDGQGSVTLNIYSGKKGVSITVGGSARSPLRKRVEELLAVPAPGKPVDGQADLGIKDYEGFDGHWIGTDESGKGDFFGPLVVAAVMVDQQTEKILSDRGVKDCKALSDDKVRAFAAAIREICSGRYVELELIPSHYNRLYNNFRSEGKNLNQLLAWAHARAIEDLLEKHSCRFAIIDQFADERLVLSRLFDKGKNLTLLQAHRAERNIAVAAASVLARDRFLAGLDRIRREYGIELPKGASAAVIDAGRRFAAAHGRQELQNAAKLHFKTMEQI